MHSKLGEVGRLGKLIGDQEDRSIVLSVFGELFELSSYVTFETLNIVVTDYIELEHLHNRTGTLVSSL